MSKKNSFETSITELEKIVERLESGEVTLDESIELYQKGIKLSELCNSILDNAKQQIEYIKNNESDEHTGDDNEL